jgi:heme-degrading monooxygenase HmoA
VWPPSNLSSRDRYPIFMGEMKSMPFVSITRLRVRSWTYMLAFVVQTLRIARQAAKADGNLAVKLLWDSRNTFWTCTTWSSEDSAKAFMHAKPHGPTMRSLLNWCDEAALAHWIQSGEELPSWEEAHRRLQEEGRRSKVNHPSAAHTSYSIRTSTVGLTRELRFK